MVRACISPSIQGSRGVVPVVGLQPLACNLLPLWHPVPGAKRRMRRGALPHCRDAPGTARGSRILPLRPDVRGNVAEHQCWGWRAPTAPGPASTPAPGSQEDWMGRPGGRVVGS